MSTMLQTPEKENVTESEQLEKPRAEPRHGQDRVMERQLETPLHALINQREPLFLDELPDIQLESPLNALINQRERLTLSEQAAHQSEFLLNAQMNQREQKHLDELPAQLEPPINALINRHGQRRFWRSPRNKTNS